eukprot:756986-Hanusia_phi.AAC.1
MKLKLSEGTFKSVSRPSLRMSTRWSDGGVRPCTTEMVERTGVLRFYFSCKPMAGRGGCQRCLARLDLALTPPAVSDDDDEEGEEEDDDDAKKSNAENVSGFGQVRRRAGGDGNVLRASHVPSQPAGSCSRRRCSTGGGPNRLREIAMLVKFASSACPELMGLRLAAAGGGIPQTDGAGERSLRLVSAPDVASHCYSPLTPC